jgi:hypothetical protein
MDKTNVRKNPFGSQSSSNVQEPLRNIPPSNSHFTEPPVRQVSGGNNPPPKGVSHKAESDQSNINNTSSMNSISRSFNQMNIQNQNTEIENILKEFENIRCFNASKGFIRSTTERYIFILFRIPANQQLFNDASFPIGLIINPLAYYEPYVILFVNILFLFTHVNFNCV